MITTFRGLGGEVVGGFCRIRTLFTAVPVMFFFGLLTFLLGLLQQAIPPLLVLLLGVFAFGYILGRFAVPASQGELDAGVLTTQLEPGDAFGFAIRYTALTIIWGAVVFGLGLLAAQGAMGGVMGIMASPAEAGFSLLAGAAALVITLLGPSMSCLIAVYADDLGEILSAGPYVWLFQHRRSDLFPFLAALLGGGFVFYMVILVPLALVAVVLVKISPELGVIAAPILFSLPFAAMPVLMGRMAGAFVQGGADIDGVLSPAAEKVILSPVGGGSAAEVTAASSATTAAADVEMVVALDRDPDDKVLAWLAEHAAKFPEVESAWYFLMGTQDGEVVHERIGLSLKEDTPLGKRQGVFRELRDLLPEGFGLEIQLLLGDNAEEVSAKGLRVYQRK